MWKCPKCDAINYEKGACECCGFDGGKENKEGYRIIYPYIPRAYESWDTPKIWC